MPKFLTVKPMVENEKISMGVDRLLHLVKHSMLDIAKTTGELSKANDGENHVTFEELVQVIKYALDTKKSV